MKSDAIGSFFPLFTMAWLGCFLCERKSEFRGGVSKTGQRSPVAATCKLHRPPIPFGYGSPMHPHSALNAGVFPTISASLLQMGRDRAVRPSGAFASTGLRIGLQNMNARNIASEGVASNICHATAWGYDRTPLSRLNPIAANTLDQVFSFAALLNELANVLCA